MRIALASANMNGGIGIAVRELVIALRKRGHDVGYPDDHSQTDAQLVSALESLTFHSSNAVPLLEALPAVAQHFPNHTLLIAGEQTRNVHKESLNSLEEFEKMQSR